MHDIINGLDGAVREINRLARRWCVALGAAIALALVLMFACSCAAIPGTETPETPIEPPEVPPVDPPAVVTDTNTPPVPPATGEVRRMALCFGWTAVDPLAADWAGWEGDCPGCDNDAREMADRLTPWGYEAKVILNDKARWDDVIIQVAYAGKNLRAGDWLWISCSGHGGQLPDDNGDESDGKDETICTWDRNVRDDAVKRMLKTYIPDGVHVVLFSDQCHSEGNWRAFGRVLQRAVSLGRWGKVQARVLVKDDDLRFPLIQLAGCRENNYSYSAQSDDGTWHGTWTQTFLGNARDGDGLRTAFARAKSEMPPNQMPVWVEGGAVTDAFRDAPLSAASKAPAAPAARASWSPERKPKSVVFAWDPPLSNVDQTALTNLAAYRVYQLEDSGAVTRLREVPSPDAAPNFGSASVSTTFTNVTASKIVLGVTAVNALGDESEMSAWVTNRFSVPNMPRNAR